MVSAVLLFKVWTSILQALKSMQSVRELSCCFSVLGHINDPHLRWKMTPAALAFHAVKGLQRIPVYPTLHLVSPHLLTPQQVWLETLSHAVWTPARDMFGQERFHALCLQHSMNLMVSVIISMSRPVLLFYVRKCTACIECSCWSEMIFSTTRSVCTENSCPRSFQGLTLSFLTCE